MQKKKNKDKKTNKLKMKKATIIVVLSIMTFSTTFSQTIEIGQNAEEVKGLIELKTREQNKLDSYGRNSRARATSDVLYFNGQITEVTQCYAKQLYLNLQRYVNYCDRYMMKSGKLDYTLTQYENVSKDELIGIYDNLYEGRKIDNLYFDKELKHFSKIYLAKNGQATVEWGLVSKLSTTTQISLKSKLAEIISKEREKQSEKKKKDIVKANNFSIPFEIDRRLESTNKPILKDSLIQYVIFESAGVVFRTRNQSGGYDDTHKWILKLTLNEFVMKTTGIEETYTVLSAKYDNQLHFQEFQLADGTGQFTHKLNICYSRIFKSYNILFSSLDNKDDYQFQDITLKEIEFQKKMNEPLIYKNK